MTPARINDILQAYLKTRGTTQRPLRRITCSDGFSLSVQASDSTRCTPRTNAGPWSAVEVGYPSGLEPLLLDWAEETGVWTETVYNYVPIELVAAVIELHGGFSETFLKESVGLDHELQDRS